MWIGVTHGLLSGPTAEGEMFFTVAEAYKIEAAVFAPHPLASKMK